MSDPVLCMHLCSPRLSDVPIGKPGIDMANSASIMLIVICTTLCLPLAALAQQNNQTPQSAGSNYPFSVGSRPADVGTGFSIYSATSATADQQFRVQCSCQDFSLATATCPAPRYECYCSPSAALTCE
ncbi:hypothetical protein BJ928_11012 [Rhizobium sp. WW_1]|jgi:hypothetical protein|nr:hypothetical protein BJ928_11012 [Rhizobium sp. WW_1]